ncbi:MAG: glucoamylase family protein [Phycisphaerales bacterium]
MFARLNLLLLVVLCAVSPSFAAGTLLAGYEISESNLTLSSPDSGMILSKVQGGISGAPAATQGSYVLKAAWTGQSDGKVEVKHQWSGFTFDLSDKDQILVDVYMTTQLYPALVGVWDDIFGWHQATSVPTTAGQWYTLRLDVSDCTQTSLNHIYALLFQGMPVSAGTVYFDNLRLASYSPQPTAEGHTRRIDITWQPILDAELDGYYIYRSNSPTGTFTKLNSSLDDVPVYSDFLGADGLTRCYYVTSVVDGLQSRPSAVVSEITYVMTDEQLLDSIQRATFRYCWDFAHPDSGMIRERFAKYDRQTVTTGGSGFGLFNIIVGAERGWITREQAAERTLKMVSFLQDDATRYHGVWSHWMDGTTGQTIPADYNDSGVPIIAADIIETADMIQGMLACRKYFDASNPIENEIRARTTQLWQEVEWNWYRRTSETDGKRLWWSWSPDSEFAYSFAFGGAETMNAYLLAIASPTHSIPASCYYDGFGFEGGYRNGNRYYGYTQWVSAFETPMFWTHYSFLGFDPRNKHDNYCNYFENNRNTALIDRAYCIANPKGFTGYAENVWGLTSSYGPSSYEHAPGSKDDGTIAPTAALSSMPYCPEESIAAMKNFYYTYGSKLWGPLGFYDAFNLQQNWYCNDYLAIDQGTIVPMVENYRTGLCWDLFMANSEIWQMLDAIGWATRQDNGLNYEYYEGTWTSLPDLGTLTPAASGIAHNFDIGLRQQDDYFAIRFTGYFDVNMSGLYTFYLYSDDGSRLYIDDVSVVNNDGQHSAQEKSGSKYLLAGRHSIRVDYFDYDGGNSLQVSYSRPGVAKQQVPVNKLFRCNFACDFSGDCSVDFEDLKVLVESWLVEYDFMDFALLADDWLK